MGFLGNLVALPGNLWMFYWRVVGLTLLISYGLLRKAWINVKPALAPIVDIFENIDYDAVNVTSVMQQFTRLVLMAGILYCKLVMGIWDTLTKPFRKQVDRVKDYFESLNREYTQKLKEY